MKRYRALMIMTLPVLCAHVVGCTPEPVAALDLELVQDLNINTPDQVLSRINTIMVIVDSPDGLYAPGSERTDGDFEIRDADGDEEDLELVVTVPVQEGRLPWVRLERGGLPTTLLDIAVLGGDGGQTEEHPVAEGLVRGVVFEEGVTPLSIPFNIRPELLPPRVTDVIPGDGERLPRCAFSDVVVLFSKPVDAESLEGAILIEPGGAPLEILTDVSGIVAHLKVATIESEYELTYQVDISTDVIDVDGQHLDDVPTLEGDQPFSRAFRLTCIEPSTGPDFFCAIGAPEYACPFAHRLRCIEGVCTPATCDGAACTEPFLCNPSRGFCEMDCRLYGEFSVCPDELPRCDDSTGLCTL